MTAAAAWTHPGWLVEFDPLRDKTYRSTRLGGDVADFLAWLELGGASPRTLDQYERDLARACLMFPAKGLEDLTDADAMHIARSFPAASRRVRVAAFKSFYKWAIRSRRCRWSPFDTLPAIKRRPKEIYDLFTSAEIDLLTGLDIRDGALMQIMFDTGARKGDCVKLTLGDWWPEATPEMPFGTIVFRKGKGGTNRMIPCTELVSCKLEELKVLDGVNPGDHLWYTKPGGHPKPNRTRPLGDGSFDRWWRRCLETACVRYRNPHLTRHTFANRFLRGRGRLESLQLMLGHASIATTADLYGHLDMRDAAIDMGLIEHFEL